MKFVRNMPLSRKLPITITLASLVIIMIFGTLQVQQATRAVEAEARSAYKSFVAEKSIAIERWLEDAKVDVLALADSYAIQVALRDFIFGWETYGPDVQDDLRRIYISDNPHPVGQKDELVDADESSAWARAHSKHHMGLRAYQRARGYYDLFLFDMSGNLVYSVFKEDDFALNFVDGTYAESGLGEVFQQAEALDPGEFHMTDIAPYAPSAGAPALFMSTPVFANGERVGIVAVQLPLDVMGSILTASELLGETGEAYLVDNNLRALTDASQEVGFKAMDTLPGTPAIAAVLAGESGYFTQISGVNGHTVVASTQKVKTPRGDYWGMVFELDEYEARAFARQARTTATIGLAITALLLSALVFLSVKAVTRRIDTLVAEIERLAAEDYTQVISGQDRADEVGVISKTLAHLQVRLKEGADSQEREKRVQEENERVVTVVSDSLKKLARGDFTGTVDQHFPEEHKPLRYSINDALSNLNSVVSTVRSVADGIDRGAEEISDAAGQLSERTERQAVNLERTAAALEQVTVSVQSAADHAQSVEHSVAEARTQAEDSGQIVRETIAAMSSIEASSSEISQVIGLIDEIAFQTNLLALNAGVEAARAGEAGRGFAVVASEVRGLAQRAGNAAKEIKSMVADSVLKVEAGSKMVGKTGEALATIVEQVQEISTAVQQIAKSAAEQSSALNEINSSMAEIDQVTQTNAAMVEENTAASHSLRQDAGLLIKHVGHFRTVDEQLNANERDTHGHQEVA